MIIPVPTVSVATGPGSNSVSSHLSAAHMEASSPVVVIETETTDTSPNPSDSDLSSTPHIVTPTTSFEVDNMDESSEEITNTNTDSATLSTTGSTTLSTTGTTTLSTTSSTTVDTRLSQTVTTLKISEPNKISFTGSSNQHTTSTQSLKFSEIPEEKNTSAVKTDTTTTHIAGETAGSLGEDRHNNVVSIVIPVTTIFTSRDSSSVRVPSDTSTQTGTSSHVVVTEIETTGTSPNPGNTDPSRAPHIATPATNLLTTNPTTAQQVSVSSEQQKEPFLDSITFYAIVGSGGFLVLVILLGIAIICFKLVTYIHVCINFSKSVRSIASIRPWRYSYILVEHIHLAISH